MFMVLLPHKQEGKYFALISWSVEIWAGNGEVIYSRRGRFNCLLSVINHTCHSILGVSCLGKFLSTTHADYTL